MRVRARRISNRRPGGPRRRLGDQRGFAMIVAMGVLLVTLLLTAAIFSAVQGDAALTGADLNGKEAYAAAQSGVQAYLYALNTNATNSQWWETCSNDTAAMTGVPGSTNGESYSYAPVPANGATACSTSNPVGTLIDTSTGTLRLKFTGYAGPGCATGSAACQTRTVVASFKTLSPLSFLWYTVYETIDSSLPGGSGCNVFYYQGSGPPSSCYIYWVTGDQMNGPMYTQDQFLINNGAAPVFGRNSNDLIESEAPKGDKVCAFNNCYSAQISNAVPNAPQVPLPSDNANLLSDATAHGKVFTGTTTLSISGNTATGYNCPTTSSSCTAVSINLSTYPIIYGANGSGCTSSYNPQSVTYPSTTVGGQTAYYGACGDIYVSGTYSTPVTIAAADDVVVTGNLENSTDTSGTTNPTGSATAGLVANQYVRVMHTCSGNPNVTIDAAILTLQHSFFVDNYNCGSGAQGTLTVHGAIAQYYRGAVGTVGSTGYLKNYNYDDRLALILPPYLFDLQNTEWTVFRETLCSNNSSAPSAISCSA
jgi:Tfp pilus assembly protein PilX